MKGRIVVAVLVASVAVGAATRAWGSATRGGGKMAQGYLGVDVRDLTEDEANALRVRDPRGAEITRLDHDGPACKAGMREHDVILQMDARGVEGQEQFRRMLHETAAGHTAVLTVLRDGQQMTIKATMADRDEVMRKAWEQHIAVVDPDGPPPEPAEGRPDRGKMGFLHGGITGAGPGRGHGFLSTMLGAPYTGLEMEPVGPQLGEFFGVQSGVGLLVRSVEVNSPAAAAGMRAGDVVIKANGATIASESDWTRSLHETRGKATPVLLLRDRKEQTVTLTPDAKRRARLEQERTTEPDEARLAGMDLL